MEQNLVSIIMPTYNCADFIEESIKSVIAQHHKNWELLIVDDASTDHTAAVLAPYLAKYPNIHYTCLKQNSGSAAARSGALKQAQGDYVAFLDSDDLWTPNKLSLQIDFMQQNKAAFSATGYEVLKEDGTSKWVAIIPPEKTNYDKMLRLSCPIQTSTVVYDRRVVGNVQIPDAGVLSSFALWLEVLHLVPACYGLPDVLAQKRGRCCKNKENFFCAYWQLCRKTEQLNFIPSVWYLLCGSAARWAGVGIKKRNFERERKREIADSVLYYE